MVRALKIPLKVKVFRRRTKAASVPGTVVSDETDQSVRLRQIYFDQDELVENEVASVDELMDPAQQSGVLWIDVVGVGNGEVIESLGQRFELHPLAMEDVVHTHQRSKFDDYGDRIYFVVRMLRDEADLSSEQVSLFLGPNFVISIQEREGDCFEPIRERIRQHARVRHRKADYLFYALIDAIIDGYFPRLEDYGLRLEELEEQIFKKDVRLEEIYNIRSDLVRIRKHVWQHREAIQSLNKQDHELISSDTQVFIRDCYDHTIQLIDVAESFRDQCTNLRELHLSEMSARQNEVMKTLTIFATIFMPMSFVAGVYGMNFDHHASQWNMPETEWYYGYPFALGIMGVIGFGLLFYFWRKGWLKD